MTEHTDAELNEVLRARLLSSVPSTSREGIEAEVDGTEWDLTSLDFDDLRDDIPGYKRDVIRLSWQKAYEDVETQIHSGRFDGLDDLDTYELATTLYAETDELSTHYFWEIVGNKALLDFDEYRAK